MRLLFRRYVFHYYLIQVCLMFQALCLPWFSNTRVFHDYLTPVSSMIISNLCPSQALCFFLCCVNHYHTCYSGIVFSIVYFLWHQCVFFCSPWCHPWPICVTFTKFVSLRSSASYWTSSSTMTTPRTNTQTTTTGLPWWMPFHTPSLLQQPLSPCSLGL